MRLSLLFRPVRAILPTGDDAFLRFEGLQTQGAVVLERLSGGATRSGSLTLARVRPRDTFPAVDFTVRGRARLMRGDSPPRRQVAGKRGHGR
jgi:hypothetical protein